MTFDDLKPRPDSAPLTADRAFTIAELIVYRVQAKDQLRTAGAALDEAAREIAAVARAWREKP